MMKILKILLLIIIMCTTLCQSSNVNNKLVNKRLPFDGGLATKDLESAADDLDVDDKKDYFGSSEFSHSHSEILNPEYDSSNDLDKLQTNSAPLFFLEPENSFVVKNKPAHIKCKTANALKLIFKCSGNTDPPSTFESHVDPMSGVHLLEATATISRNLVEEYFGNSPFSCECHAWSSRGGEIKSRPAQILIAYIRKQFTVSPLTASIEPGSKLEIKCTPPPAMPEPQISWLRNNENIPTTTSSVTITKEGNLIINSAKLQDSANYTCVAENIAGRRMSDPVLINVRGDKKWTEWSTCNKNCIKIRRRICNSKLSSNMNLQEDCYANDIETVRCEGGECPSVVDAVGANKPSEYSDRIVYFLLIIVCTLCVIFAIFFAHSRNRKRRVPSFITTDDEIQPKNYDSPDKMYHRQQLEPPKKSFNYEYNSMHPEYSPAPFQHQLQHPHQIQHQALYENHYHEPTLAVTYSVPIDKINQKTPLTQTTTTTTSTSYGLKRIHNSDTISSSTESLDSTQVIEIESSSASVNDKNPKTNMIEQMVTSNGGWLELEHLKTSLSIPELTFERTRKYNIFLTVLHNEFIKNQITCNFNDNSTHLSSIIYCGPPDILLNKPVILKFPHCANNYQDWDISLLHNACTNDNSKKFIDMEEKDKWKRIASTQNDVVNPQAFIQLDDQNAFIISRVLGKLLLVGESKNTDQWVDKRMKIALFGPKHKIPTLNDFNIRVYILEDYPSSIDYCTIIERNLGNEMLVECRDFLFKNNKEDLWIGLNCSGGWITRNESQKIPYSHVWKNSYLLHCDFLLEKNNNVNKLNMEIVVKQRHGNDILLSHILFSSH